MHIMVVPWNHWQPISWEVKKIRLMIIHHTSNKKEREMGNTHDAPMNCLLRCMITKGSQNTSGMKTGSHIRSLIWQIKVCNLGNIIIKDQYIAGLDVTMDDMEIALFMQVLEPFCSPYSNFNTLCPRKNRTRLCSFNPLPPYQKKNIMIIIILLRNCKYFSSQLYSLHLWERALNH